MFIVFSNVFTKLLDKLSDRCGIQSEKMKPLFWVAPEDLCFRIMTSLVPPVTMKYRKLNVDLQGPMFAVVLLIILLNYGSALKRNNITPLESVLLYIILMPVLCFILNKLGQSWLTFLEVFSLIGYALYGHILTLLVALLFYLEESNAFFFTSMIVFGGLSTFRMVLLQLQAIPLPGARLLVCSFVSVIHILFLIFLHFTYMHPNFEYGKNIKSPHSRL